MKKRLILLLCAIVLSMQAALSGCAIAGATGDEITPQKSGFNFVFKYGVTGKNVLDTFQGTYTKDMISDPSITVPMTLTAPEMSSINQKMTEIDFFSYPEKFTVTVPEGAIIGEVTPYITYYFRVEAGGKSKELTWEDKIVNQDPAAAKLKELINLIQNIIESKPEYQSLPQPKGGYL